MYSIINRTIKENTMAKNQNFSPKASAYILTLISRLDTAICFRLFRFFSSLPKDNKESLFEEYFESISDKEEEFSKAVKQAGSMENEEKHIKYPFDIFGTKTAIKFLEKWRETEKFTTVLSKSMIIYIPKKTQLIDNLNNVYELRQELEHPIDKNKFVLEKSLKSLFLFIPPVYMNHIISLLNEEDKEKVSKIREWVIDTNRKFKENLNEKNNQEESRQAKNNKRFQKSVLLLNKERFTDKKTFAFMGEGNKSILENIITAEVKSFSQNKKEFFAIKDKNEKPKIPKNELFLMFDFILEIQSVFRRYYCPLFNKKSSADKYSELRNLVSHSYLYFNKGGRPYVEVAWESIKLALDFFDNKYKSAVLQYLEKTEAANKLREDLEKEKIEKNWKETDVEYKKKITQVKNKINKTINKEIKDIGIQTQKEKIENKEIIKTEKTLKTDFIRSLNAICNKKNYFYIEISTPKGEDKEGFNVQDIEVKFSKEENDKPKNQNKLPRCAMDKFIEETVSKKKANFNLEKAEMKVEKRIYLNLIRQKMKQKIMDIKRENQLKNNVKVIKKEVVKNKKI